MRLDKDPQSSAGKTCGRLFDRLRIVRTRNASGEKTRTPRGRWLKGRAAWTSGPHRARDRGGGAFVDGRAQHVEGSALLDAYAATKLRTKQRRGARNESHRPMAPPNRATLSVSHKGHSVAWRGEAEETSGEEEQKGRGG
eukprot:6185390-Pleurochrysis_carterae.AAC.3